MDSATGLAIIRFVAWTLEACCAVIAAHYVVRAWSDETYRLDRPERLTVAMGLVAKCFGWSVHQFYWWLWQVSVIKGAVATKLAIESGTVVVSMAYALVFVGEIMVISVFLRRVASRYWPLAGVALLIVLALMGATLMGIS